MLKQLAQLSIETDGRYATAAELQFLKDYLQSMNTRVSAYKKIRDSAPQIVEDVGARMVEQDPFIFRKGSKDISGLYQRDTSNILRSTAAAMLLNNLDRLRDSFLLWHRTIVKAFQVDHLSQAAYQIMPGVMKRYLTDEEAKQVMPALYLNQTIFDG
jgi:hypothetical protein